METRTSIVDLNQTHNNEMRQRKKRQQKVNHSNNSVYKIKIKEEE